MNIAYFDCFAGISGDMAVAAMIHAGVPVEVVEQGLDQLGLDRREARVVVRPIVRSQIHALRFDVLGPDDLPVDRAPGFPPDHTHDHGHDHGHSHTHHHDHRSHRDIADMIERSALSPGVKRRAVAIFRAIATGEARVHDMDVDEVHFHEVGALDSIVDIVATAICLEHLGVDRVYSSVIPLGSGGLIRTQHGSMPLPAPATLEILKGYPVTLTSVPFELTTPTGAGIIAAQSSGVLDVQTLRARYVGFGAGTRELPDRPNLLRVVVGELEGAVAEDMVTMIEATIDDMNPQVYPFLIDQLLESGALDALVTPVIMKKGRPGMVLTVTAPPDAARAIADVIFAETTTIGVRTYGAVRRKLDRDAVNVDTEFGVVRMKRIEAPAGARIVPEYEDARRLALEHRLPLLEVMRRLVDAARREQG